MLKRARIHELFAQPRSGAAIEVLSFETIDREAPSHTFRPEEWEVVRRMIHATADLSLAEAVRFSQDAIAVGIEALEAGRPLYVDSNMIRSGLSLARLRSACEGYDQHSLHCHVADPDVAEEAERTGLPRSIFAVRKAKAILEGGVAVFGNAPGALLELNRLVLEEGLRPALVIAVPVGFVHVLESKEELMELGVPYIALAGRRGGSPIAVSILHALCSLAARRRTEREAAGRPTADFDAVILLGHGSRVPGAGRSMKMVAEALRKGARHPIVEICHMSRLGPHFEETLAECVRKGARSVVLLPYFLHEGLHMKLDIPSMMQHAGRAYPHVQLVFGKNLGFDPLLVRLVEKRIEESRALGDVRKLSLPGEDDYPIPPGQCEFVPMLPEEAAKWKGILREEEGTIQRQQGKQE
jgi:precorrin isomerase